MVRYAKILVPFFVVVPALFGFMDDGVHPVITSGPLSMTAGTNGTFTVTVNQAGSTDTTLYITTNNPTDFSVPYSVDLPAGATQVRFQVYAAAVGNGTVTASANGNEATSGQVLIVPSS